MENKTLKNKELENEYKQKIQYFDRSEIYKRLNNLYAPLQLLRRTSKQLHDIFKDGKDFRTLPQLLNGNQFDENGKQLIAEIIKISDECRDLIVLNSGLIDNKDLRDLHLPKLLSHNILIKKAYKGEISNQLYRFEGYEFPNEIDIILDKKVNDLYADLDKLNRVN